MDNAFLALVAKRQSVRKYLPQPVPRNVIDRCLDAARLAPSACNSQPWSFIVADTGLARSRLAEAAFSGVYAINAFAAKAPVLIAVVAERSTFIAALGGRIRSVEYNLIDVGIACEHLVLQAAAEGVGTCWLGWFDEKSVKKSLGLPRNAHVPILIGMGYPATEETRVKSRKPLDEIRRYAE